MTFYEAYFPPDLFNQNLRYTFSIRNANCKNIFFRDIKKLKKSYLYLDSIQNKNYSFKEIAGLRSQKKIKFYLTF